MISEDALKALKSNTYRFGEFQLEAENLLLLRKSEVVPLAPKACEVLLALIESNGKLITKQEIIDKVWVDTFVEEANLTHHISALRKALGEDKNGRKFIETIPRRGYRFVAEVHCTANSEAAEIVFTERDSVKVVESATFEADNLAVKDVSIIENQPTTPARKNRRKIVWSLAAVTVALLFGTTAFFAYRNFYSSKSPPAPTEIKIKRLTPDADADSASVSPDGASVVFDRVENGRHGLWRKQIASGEMTQLMPDVSMYEVALASTRFSPDGRWIYYAQMLFREKEKTMTIYRIPAGGGTAQKILPGLAVGTDYSISPDGKQIAYTFDVRQVIVADIETGNKQIIVDWDGVKRSVSTGNNSVAWSPDGSRLIFGGGYTENNEFVFQLFETNLRTNELKQIPLPEKFGVWQIEWLADDSGLVVTHKNEIWFVNHHTGETRRISREKDNFIDLRISADGKTIAATQRLGQFNIWTAPADNFDKRRQITIGAAAQHGTDGVEWMSDGRILYTSTQSGAMEIWTMNADGGDRKQLTNSEPGSYKPQLTKDGRYIVFLSDRSGINQVWRMEADGTNPVQLTDEPEGWDYNLSPEGNIYYITFLSDEQKYQVYKIPVEGGESVRFDELYSESPPTFSPDGKWILFFGGKTKDEKPHNAIVERATGKIIRYFDIFGRWSPDSKSIIFTKNDGKELRRQPIDGSPAEKIYDLSPLRIAGWNFSADGKQMVFSLGNTTSEIVVIQNFSENVK